LGAKTLPLFLTNKSDLYRTDETEQPEFYRKTLIYFIMFSPGSFLSESFFKEAGKLNFSRSSSYGESILNIPDDFFLDYTSGV